LEDVIGLYRKRAKRYDLTANLYYLIGFREWAYRKQAVAALNLQPGDTVVEIGCGTGLNFPLLQAAVGPQGQVIGVDLTDAMLAQASQRVERAGWSNVVLVHRDAGEYNFPEKVDGIISTFAITLAPGFDRIIKHGARALAPGKRFVILDFKEPYQLPDWLVKFAVFITRPFGVTRELAVRHPWESIEQYMTNTSFEEQFMGFTYISTGEAHKPG